MEVVHAEDAVILICTIVACNCDISCVDERIDCHAVTGLEPDLWLEGRIVDCTNHL